VAGIGAILTVATAILFPLVAPVIALIFTVGTLATIYLLRGEREKKREW